MQDRLFLILFTATKVGAPSFAFFAKGGTRAVRIEVLSIPPFAKSAKDGAPHIRGRKSANTRCDARHDQRKR